MLAFTVNDTKSFMNLLLKGDTFDAFLFRQGELTTSLLFSLKVSAIWIFIPPRSRRQGFPLCALGGNASFVFQAIKGNKLPKSIKLVFSLRRRSFPISQYQGGISEYSL